MITLLCISQRLRNCDRNLDKSKLQYTKKNAKWAYTVCQFRKNDELRLSVQEGWCTKEYQTMRNIMFLNMLLVNDIYVTNRTQINPIYKGINVNPIDTFIRKFISWDSTFTVYIDQSANILLYSDVFYIYSDESLQNDAGRLILTSQFAFVVVTKSFDLNRPRFDAAWKTFII